MSGDLVIYSGKGHLSDAILNEGISSWSALTDHIKNLPYGRTLKKELLAVLDENKGTCSTKHALAVQIAKEQGWNNIDLVLVMYKMNSDNTPGTAEVLNESELVYLPEAHCVIRHGDVMVDLTTTESSYEAIISDILQTQVIEPGQIGAWKVNYHKRFLANWLIEGCIDMTLDQAWKLREQCIMAISRY